MPAEVETMFSAREVPWHGLGTVVEGALTAEEALRTAGLDWEVLKLPGYFQAPDGSMHRFPGSFMTVRATDLRPLGDGIREDYALFQNWDAFKFADHLVDTGEAKYETAGSLREGRQVWLTMKLPREILVAGHDSVGLYLLLTSSHDRSKAITAAVTPVRTVCMNTLNLALARARQRWSVRHVATATARLQEARDTMRLTFRYADEFEAKVQRLVEQEYTAEQMDKLLDALLPQTPRVEVTAARIRGLFLESPTLEHVRGTKWAALNAVGEYYSWTRDPRTDESRLKGDWDTWGAGFKARQRTLELLAA